MPIVYTVSKYLHSFPYFVLCYSVAGFAHVANKAVEEIFRFAKDFTLDLPE